MTDKEIIKAMELCFSEGFRKCEECPLKSQQDEMFTCIRIKQKNAFDLINRQQAEIEKLKEENKFHRKTIQENAQRALEVTIEEVDKAKTEAIKSFAERLNDTILDKSDRSLDNPNGNDYFISDVIEDIDNLVKEMVGENDG